MKAVILAAFALAFISQRAPAQIGQPGTVQRNILLEFTFPTTGPTEPPFPDPTWTYWFNSPGGGPVTNDPTTDASNPVAGANTSDSGSLIIVTPFPAGFPSQDVFFGCFADNGSYNFSEVADITTYQAIQFDILVQSGQTLFTNASSTNYGSIQAGFIDTGYGYQEVGAVTIPSTASTGWVHLSVPINQALVGTAYNQLQPGIAFNYNNFTGYPTNGTTFTFWLDNIALVPYIGMKCGPITMTGTPAVAGLNTIWTVPGADGQFNRYQIADTNDGVDGDDSFYSQSSVTYSYTISQFPAADTAAQAHFFIVNGPDSQTGTTGVVASQYDIAADYIFANCIFVTVGSDGAGNGVMNLRWKTNDANGNLPLFSTNEPYVSFTNAPLLGTYSVTFTGGNVITLTAPNGNTTNYTMPSAAAAMFSESNGPSTFLLGSQPNATTYGGGDVIYSSFSRTGNHAFTDNFATDNSLNTSHWEYLSTAPGAVIVPPTESIWLTATPPDSFILITSPALGPTANWTVVDPIAQFPDNGGVLTLLPAVGQTGYLAPIGLCP